MAERKQGQATEQQAQVLVKRVLEGADDGEDGQANGVLQHYAYRCVPISHFGRPIDRSDLSNQSPWTNRPPHRAIAFAERFLASTPPSPEHAGRWFHTGTYVLHVRTASTRRI